MSCAARRITHLFFLLGIAVFWGCEKPSDDASGDGTAQPDQGQQASQPEPEEAAPKSYSELMAEVKSMGQVMIRAAKGKNLIGANAEMRNIDLPLDGLEKAAMASSMSDEDKEKVKAAVAKAFDVRQTMIVAVSTDDQSVDYDAIATQLEEVLADVESVSAE